MHSPAGGSASDHKQEVRAADSPSLGTQCVPLNLCTFALILQAKCLIFYGLRHQNIQELCDCDC